MQTAQEIAQFPLYNHDSRTVDVADCLTTSFTGTTVRQQFTFISIHQTKRHGCRDTLGSYRIRCG